MKQRIRNEEGSILVVTAVAVFTLLIFTATSIDVSCLLTARNQLQCAVDASALAGATGLIFDQGTAIYRAYTVASRNSCVNQSVQVATNDISFPSSDQIRVQANKNINLYFAKVIGLHSANISAVAVAELATIVGTPGMRPWAIPDLGWPSGSPVVLKSGSLGAPSTVPSFYYAIDFPPINRGTPVSGACEYRRNIMYGTSSEVYINDVIQVEPGNMVGPTKQGMQYLMGLDPDAYWDGTRVCGSQFPGYSSPRIVKIPLYDSNDPPYAGRSTIEVIGLASFFIVGLQGNDVIGIYMERTSGGKYGHGYSFLKSAHLIQ